MKEILFKLWTSIKPVTLEIILGFIALLSWYEAYTIGNTSNGYEYYGERASVSTPITSGYDGGALAMGLITCACIIGIVWLEVNRLKQRK